MDILPTGARLWCAVPMQDRWLTWAEIDREYELCWTDPIKESRTIWERLDADDSV